MLADDLRPPWDATLTQGEHSLILYFLALAGLGFVVGCLRGWLTAGEVGTRYRSAVIARLGVNSVAALTYLFLILEFRSAYVLRHGHYSPTSSSINTFSVRYVEWSISVPLLVIELLAVCALAGAAARRVRAIAASLAFVMIFLGFLGSVVTANGTSASALIIFGAASTAVWVVVNVILIRTVRRSLPQLTDEAAGLLRRASIILLAGWTIYPVVYVVPLFAFGGGWSTTIQVALCLADLVIKLVFGGLIHRVAKLRTAEDVRAGVDIHPESIWISSVKQSDSGAAGQVFLEPTSVAHPPRTKPSTSVAEPSEPDPNRDYFE